jgi:hypothetical protein
MRVGKYYLGTLADWVDWIKWNFETSFIGEFLYTAYDWFYYTIYPRPKLDLRPIEEVEKILATSESTFDRILKNKTPEEKEEWFRKMGEVEDACGGHFLGPKYFSNVPPWKRVP